MSKDMEIIPPADKKEIVVAHEAAKMLPPHMVLAMFGEGWERKSPRDMAVACDEFIEENIRQVKDNLANICAGFWYEKTAAAWKYRGWKSWDDYCGGMTSEHKHLENARTIDRWAAAFETWVCKYRFDVGTLQMAGPYFLGKLTEGELIKSKQEARRWIEIIRTSTPTAIRDAIRKAQAALRTPRAHPFFDAKHAGVDLIQFVTHSSPEKDSPPTVGIYLWAQGQLVDKYFSVNYRVEQLNEVDFLACERLKRNETVAQQIRNALGLENEPGQESEDEPEPEDEP